MSKSKKYYLDIDIIRIVSCISILLYHLGMLKGGYLAVCTFFVLSGYLSCTSSFKKEEFSLFNYYKSRILKIYLPLIVVVFVTLAAMTLFPDVIWLNLKPETTSVLLGYNNIWQIGANLDYFARHIDSPFIHLWYISILLQFDLVFPIIFIILRKLGDKIHKIVPCLLSVILSITGAVYLYIMSFKVPIMNVYYGTFTRVFSLLFGLTLGLIHSYYRPLVPNKLKNIVINRIIFLDYLIALFVLFIFINSSSIYYSISFILVTLISCRLIDHRTVILKDKLSIGDKIIKYVSSLSYGIYLFQYPVIYLFQYIDIDNKYKIITMISTIVILSELLTSCVINISKKEKLKILKWLLRVLITAVTIYGCYQFIITEDHTTEMKELENLLNQNQEIIKQKQEDYASKTKQEQDDWASTLSDLDNEEAKVNQIVSNLPLVGIGDSIMLGAVGTMSAQFPNSYFDAKVSRSAWSVDAILQDLLNRGILGNPVIFNLGANGDCSEACKNKIMSDVGNRDVYWMTVTNDQNVHFNDKIKEYAKHYSNLHIIDWNAISNGHSEYFYSDGLHLTTPGRIAYTKAIYNTLYQKYYYEYKIKKDEILKQHEEELKTKISFYGNDIMLNNYDNIQNNYTDSKLTFKKDYKFNQLIDDINNSIADNTLTYKLVFAFDNQLEITEEQYRELIELCSGHEIYIISASKQANEVLPNIVIDNVKIINFYSAIEVNSDYLMVDRVHLSPTGNEALLNLINATLKGTENQS